MSGVDEQALLVFAACCSATGLLVWLRPSTPTWVLVLVTSLGVVAAAATLGLDGAGDAAVRRASDVLLAWDSNASTARMWCLFGLIGAGMLGFGVSLAVAVLWTLEGVGHWRRSSRDGLVYFGAAAGALSWSLTALLFIRAHEWFPLGELFPGVEAAWPWFVRVVAAVDLAGLFAARRLSRRA